MRITIHSFTSRFSFLTATKHLISILLLIAQLVIYVAVWRTAPLNRMDFVAFYAATRLWQEGKNPYDLEAQCEIERPIRDGSCLPMAHPPILLPLMSVFVDDSYINSYKRWCAFLIFILGLSFTLLYLINRDLRASLHAILFTPIFISLFLGQDTAFVVLAVLIWAWCLSAKRDLIGGLALSLALIKPHLAIPLAVPLMFARPKASLGFGIGGLGLAIWSLFLVGPAGVKSLMDMLMVMAKGQGFGIDQERMCNIAAILVNAGFSPTWAWPIFLVAIATMCILLRKPSESTLALGVVITVFAAPHVHRQDLSLLVFPLILVHPLAPMVAGGLMLIAFTQNALRPVAYLLLFALAIALFKKVKDERTGRRVQSAS